MQNIRVLYQAETWYNVVCINKHQRKQYGRNKEKILI